jgi:predicted esterase
MRFAVLLACIVLVGAGEAPRTGSFKTTFGERHPESLPERFGLRYGNLDEAKKENYDIATEEFDVNVPKDYDGTIPYGLIVYTNAGKGGGAGGYASLLAKHRLIWIGASNVPNERSIVPRWGLSLDAVWNMRKQYRIDPRRIYASGFSGGGRCASMVAPTFADVFSGALYLCGCNNPVWPPEKQIGRPIREPALSNGRYALLTGETDMNKPGTKSLFESYKGMGFKHVTYLEQPGLGHAQPAAEWFEKGLDFCDQPLIEEAKGLLVQAKGLEAKKPYEACRAYRQVIDGFPVAIAERITALERFAALSPQADEILRAELAKLGTSTADKQRAFVLRVTGFPCEPDARALAETTGDKELAAILAQTGTMTAGKLEKFMAAWTGFACAEQGKEAYDALATKALEPITFMPDGKRAKPLAKFCKDWSDCPARTKAAGLLEAELAPELEAILSIEKAQSKGPKLVAFCKAWPDTAAATKAEAALKDLTAKK